MKTVVLTGASSGIGLATGEYLSQNGYKVYGLSRTSGNSPLINFIACDVTDRLQVENAFKSIPEDIFAVINNAGMGISGPVELAEENEIKKIFKVNVLGVINVCQIAIPYLRKTKGRIINIGSVAGEMTIPFQVFYSMSKAGVATISEGLNMELKPFGIKVTMVMPGDTKTGFTKNREKTNKLDNPYQDRYLRSISKMEQDEQKGKSPLTVAKVIAKVLQKKHPPIKVTVGWEYKLLIFLKRLVSARALNNILYQMYAREK
ncbi:MAG TPA: hypothetical protein DD618_04170 [Acholeplasmatales bacterium]|nr:hypothetical protein [Acholeplasmatales bacterium]